eukprot:gene15060-20264_t
METSDKSQFLNLENSDQSLWLVKVPSFVADRWAQCEADEIIGSLGISLKPKSTIPSSKVSSGNNKQLNVKLVEIKGDTIPLEFTLEESLQHDSYVAFTQNDETNSFAIDGKITKNLVLRPIENQKYRQLIRARGIKSSTVISETKLIESTELAKTAISNQTIDFFTSNRTDMKRKALDKSLSNKLSKNTGDLDSGLLKSKIFEAFSNAERMTLRDLVNYCKDVPGLTKDKDVKDILEVYAKYNVKGTYKHMWELKAQYRDSTKIENEAAV